MLTSDAHMLQVEFDLPWGTRVVAESLLGRFGCQSDRYDRILRPRAHWDAVVMNRLSPLR